MLKESCRAFFAIDLPPGVKKNIALWLRSHPRLLQQDNQRAIKWVKPENLHLTLCFLGKVTAAQYLLINERVKKVIKDVPAFPLTLTTLKLFPSARCPKVLALHLEEPAPLKMVARIISQEVAACGVLLEQREFKPHVTLGILRGKKSFHLSEIPQDLIFLSFKVTMVKLFKSEAKEGESVYTPVASYKFTKAI